MKLKTRVLTRLAKLDKTVKLTQKHTRVQRNRDTPFKLEEHKDTDSYVASILTTDLNGLGHGIFRLDTT